MKFTSFKFKDSHIAYANKKSLELGVLNNSIEKGDGNIAGFLGELCALKLIGGSLENTFNFDIKDTKGITWDVKTKRRTVAPRSNFFCSVAAYNTKQNCDNYVFVSLQNMEVGYVLGWISRKEFYEKSTFHKKGDVDPSSPPTKTFYFTADCFNLEVKHLNRF